MKHIIFILYTVLSVILLSCSDNISESQNNNAAKKYYPLKIGNYWVYQYYALDNLNNPIGLPGTDSAVITSGIRFGNKDFFRINLFRNGTPIGEEFWSVEDNKIYQIRNESNTGLSGLKDTAFVIADFGSVEWPIYYFKIDSTNYEYKGIKGWAVIEYRITGRRDFLTDSLSFNGTRFKCYSYADNFDTRYLFNHSTNWVLTQLQTEQYYFVGNIGPVSIIHYPYYLYVNYQVKEWTNGWKRQLIRYSIN